MRWAWSGTFRLIQTRRTIEGSSFTAVNQTKIFWNSSEHKLKANHHRRRQRSQIVHSNQLQCKLQAHIFLHVMRCDEGEIRRSVTFSNSWVADAEGFNWGGQIAHFHGYCFATEDGPPHRLIMLLPRWPEQYHQMAFWIEGNIDPAMKCQCTLWLTGNARNLNWSNPNIEKSEGQSRAHLHFEADCEARSGAKVAKW